MGLVHEQSVHSQLLKSYYIVFSQMCIRDSYLTEQEQAQYDKIQAEKDLAEEDAIQAQQPEIEEETPKPTLREQFEQYKPVVTLSLIHI